MFVLPIILPPGIYSCLCLFYQSSFRLVPYCLSLCSFLKYFKTQERSPFTAFHTKIFLSHLAILYSSSRPEGRGQPCPEAPMGCAFRLCSSLLRQEELTSLKHLVFQNGNKLLSFKMSSFSHAFNPLVVSIGPNFYVGMMVSVRGIFPPHSFCLLVTEQKAFKYALSI